MSSEFEEALMGLDLGAAPPETFNENVVFTVEDIQKTQIHRLKKRIIATNTLIQLHDDKKKLLVTTENMLSNLKTEYKLARDESQETCKNYKMIQEKCTMLEQQLGEYKSKCKELELSLQDNGSKEAAAQSYTNQLQLLVKERENKIEALKLENNLIKEGTIGFRKKITKLSSIIAALTSNLSNVADVVFSNRTLNKREKLSLYKYMRINRLMKEKENKNMICDIVEEAVNGDNDDDNFSDLEDTADNMVFQVPSSTIEETDKGNDSDNSISEDTGCGSSLASSDKGIFSPEYSFEGPPSVGSMKIIQKESDCQVTTTLQSPKMFKETREFATSPIGFEETKQNKSPTVKHTSKVMIDQATSPLKSACTSVHIPDTVSRVDVLDGIVPLSSIRGKEKLDGIQPLPNISEKVSFDEIHPLPIPAEKNTIDAIRPLSNIREKITFDGIEPLSPVANKKASDKFGQFCDEYSNDEEIEMILENMRVHRDLVTPIPSTPARSISRSTILSRTNKDPLSALVKMFDTPEFADAVRRVINAAKADSNSVERFSEKGINTQPNDCDNEIDEERDMELDDCDSLCEDLIILDPSLIKEKKLKGNKTTALEKIKDNALRQSTEIDNGLLAKELRSRKIVSPITEKKSDNAHATINNKKVNKKAKRIIYDDKSDGESDCTNQDLDGDSTANSDGKSSKNSLIKETNDISKLSVDGRNNKNDKKVDAKNNKSGEVKSQIGGVVTRSSRLSTESNVSELITLADLLPTEKDQSVGKITPHKNLRNSDNQSRRDSMELRDKDFDDCGSLDNDLIILHHTNQEPILNASQSLLFEEDPPSQDEEVVEAGTGYKSVAQPLQNRKTKAKKLSKLEKIRKTYQPKSKIKSDVSPRKLRTRVLSTIANQKNGKNAASSNKKDVDEKSVKDRNEKIAESSSATLNDKEVYQKAIKVAAELRAKLNERQNTTKNSGCGLVKRKTNSLATSLNNSLSEQANKSKCSDESKQTVNKENPINDHNKKDGTSLVNSRAGLQTRNMRSSTETSNSKLITLADLVSPKKDKILRRNSQHEQKVCKVTPRKLRSTSDSQSRDPVEAQDIISIKSSKKSLSPEFDFVRVSNRSKYPSFSLDKDPVIVINQSDFKEVENNPDKKRKEIETRHDNGSRTSVEEIATERRKSISPPKDKVELDKCDAKEMRKRPLEDKSISAQPKRVLRSSLRFDLDSGVNKETRTTIQKCKENDLNVSSLSTHSDHTNNHPSIINYSDLDLFTDDEPDAKKQRLRKDSFKNKGTEDTLKPEDSLLVQIIEKYGVYKLKSHPSKPAEEVVNSVHEKIEKWVTQVNECHTNGEQIMKEMDNFVEAMKKLKFKEFMSGLMKFLADPQRKIELFKKVKALPAPSMTQSEQVLLYVIPKLRRAWPNVDTVLQVFIYIEHNLFKLNGTPEFDAVESMAHFYASLCIYMNERNRLRLFMLNAMYCMSFKAIPLIKQCLEVWMLALPLAHVRTANCPLVTCIVYLLHYYKTKEDMYNRVQAIRDILNRKYFYRVTDWNETKILDMFRNAILELKDSEIERKMLRLALLILAKRQGPRWCQNKLISNLLQPLIYQPDASERTKTFCVSILGSLAKPFPMDMKVHCEIILNKLLDLLNSNPSPAMQEAVIKSLIAMNRHNVNRVTAAILKWHPTKVSPELESLLKDFVREKPVKYWMNLLRYIYRYA